MPLPALAEHDCLRPLALAAAIAVNALLLWLLLMRPYALPAGRDPEQERIRLSWVEREPAPISAPVPAVPSATAASAAPARPPDERPGRNPPRAQAVPDPAATVPYADADDAWDSGADPRFVPGSAADGYGNFERRIFEAGGDDGFAPKRHLPGVRLQDASLGGWLQREARKRACAELGSALRSRPESTAAIMASMRRWECAA